MTTIAFKDGVMACDSQITRGDECLFGVSKVATFRDRAYLAGICGSAYDFILIEGLLHQNIDGLLEPTEFHRNWEPMPDSDSTILLVDNVGALWNIRARDGAAILLPNPIDAIGSGGEYALGAMAAGASAFEAVQIACRYNVYSGGPVRAFKHHNIMVEVHA